MKAEWKTFLEAAGAEFDDTGKVGSYGSLKRELSVALTGNVFADLSHLALIAVHGEDAAEFLQGQLSNDIREVTPEHSQLSSYCNPKGRILATFRVFQRDGIYYLALPMELAEPILKRLQMFVLRAAVTLEEVTDTFVHIGVSGDDAPRELENLLDRLPQAVDEVVSQQLCTVLRIPGIHPRYEIYGPLDELKRLWDGLNVRFAPVGEPAWGLLNVAAGLPVIYPQTSEAFVPQMVNLHLVGGVSFKKGCYPGQEVVARMQYLGKLKRRMYLAWVDAEQAPQPGDELYTPDNGEQSAGKIVEARPHPDGGYLLLAVIQISGADAGQIHLDSPEGPRLEFRDLPYPFSEPC
ncbi:folate-binding protein YgfZ [Thiohalobacter sp. IOR34]|uniref:CAF17-like 4Fe-4S cluster assembly/insertion protein YgfZ n=1 Tax=Thiohalobacter sp. IOR34 TaxID=3057176 RepID=UPI0025AF3897|nr:folate-binding protein YgfZ [Thiohalobacter sp. IOR34]WJW76742.1 folate-binding protein YgfZ [Thiohalobacter sp. IOR34]